MQHDAGSKSSANFWVPSDCRWEVKVFRKPSWGEQYCLKLCAVKHYISGGKKASSALFSSLCVGRRLWVITTSIFEREAKMEMETGLCYQPAVGHESNGCCVSPWKVRSYATVLSGTKLIAAEMNTAAANGDPHVFAIAKRLPDVIPRTRSIKLIFPWISELRPLYPAESWWRIQLLTDWQNTEIEIRCIKLEYDKKPI